MVNDGLRRAASIVGIVVGIVASVAVLLSAVRGIATQSDVQSLATKAEIKLLDEQLNDVRRLAVETRAEQDRRRQTVTHVPEQLNEFRRELAELRTEVTDRLARIEQAVGVGRRRGSER